MPKQYIDNKNKQTEQFINFLIIIFLILNLLLFCENLKSKSSLNNKSIVEYTDIDYSHNNTNTFKKIKTAINLAYFNGTNKLEVIEDEISLTLNKDYFKYVLDELNEIIEIFSIKYLDDELVLLEGLIKWRE